VNQGRLKELLAWDYADVSLLVEDDALERMLRHADFLAGGRGFSKALRRGQS
jgi:hypothetical protein